MSPLVRPWFPGLCCARMSAEPLHCLSAMCERVKPVQVACVKCWVRTVQKDNQSSEASMEETLAWRMVVLRDERDWCSVAVECSP